MSETNETTNVIHDEGTVRSHIKMLADLENSTKSAHKRIDALLSISDSIQKLVIDFTKLVSTVEQQGRDLSVAVGLLTKHDERMDDLEEKMGTKETVSRLHLRLDEVEKEYLAKIESLVKESASKTLLLEKTYSDNIRKLEERVVLVENKEKNDVYEGWKSMKKTMFLAAVGMGSALLLLGLGVIWLIIKNGAAVLPIIS